MSTITDPYAPPILSEAGTITPEHYLEPEPTWSSEFTGAGAQVVGALTATIDAATPDLFALASALYADPETGFEEHRSVARLAALLRAFGYTPQVGVHGLDTALRVQAGSGAGPTIAILSEYDSLPGIGHGCGHNVICAAGAGAFLGAASVVEQVGGTVVLLGTPAEENGSGKEIMARAGAFDGIDAAMMVHPISGVSRVSSTYLGLREVRANYRGHTAHASASPHLGINALDAVVLAYNGVSMMRQQLPITDRVHGIITDGGERPNVIPDTAALHYYLRSGTPDGLIELSRQLQAIFEAAAIATGCQLELFWDDCPPCLPLRRNRVLDTQFSVHFSRLGEVIYDELASDKFGTGSTDMGNVSVRLPAMHPMLGIAPGGLSLHTAEFADHADTDRARQVIHHGALAMAATAVDLLADSGLLAAVREDFARAGGVADLSALMPPDA